MFFCFLRSSFVAAVALGILFLSNPFGDEVVGIGSVFVLGRRRPLDTEVGVLPLIWLGSCAR